MNYYIVYFGTPTEIVGSEHFSGVFAKDDSADFYFAKILLGFRAEIVEFSEFNDDDIITQSLLRTEGILAARKDSPKQVAPKRRPVSI